MAFFTKLKDRLFKSSSKLEEGLDAIVEDGGSAEPGEDTPPGVPEEQPPESPPEPPRETPPQPDETPPPVPEEDPGRDLPEPEVPQPEPATPEPPIF